MSMRVRVRFFARLKDLAGTAEQECELPGGASVQDLWVRLCDGIPELAGYQGRVGFAVNAEYCPADRLLADGDEVALLPPVSGGCCRDDPPVGLTRAPIDEQAVTDLVRAPHFGAVVTFAGIVRNHSEGRRVRELEYEAYTEMALAQLQRIREEIGERWPQVATAIVHRLGRLELGETSVFIAAASPHRAEAFEACRHVIERIKQDVPIWKKEIWDEGEEWVEGAGRPGSGGLQGMTDQEGAVQHP